MVFIRLVRECLYLQNITSYERFARFDGSFLFANAKIATFVENPKIWSIVINVAWHPVRVSTRRLDTVNNVAVTGPRARALRRGVLRRLCLPYQKAAIKTRIS